MSSLALQDCAERALPTSLDFLASKFSDGFEGQGVDEKDIETLKRIMGMLQKPGASCIGSTAPPEANSLQLPPPTPSSATATTPTDIASLSNGQGIITSSTEGRTLLEGINGVAGEEVGLDSAGGLVPALIGGLATPNRSPPASLPPTPTNQRSPSLLQTTTPIHLPASTTLPTFGPEPLTMASGAKPKPKWKRIEADVNETEDELTEPAAKRAHLLLLPLLPPDDISGEALVLPGWVCEEKNAKKYLWARNGLASLLNLVGANVWTQCIWYWIQLESDGRFIDRSRLDAKNRHKSVFDWIARACVSNWTPEKASPSSYEDQF